MVAERKGRLFCPQSPGGVEEEDGEGAAGIKLRNFLNPNGSKNGPQHACQSAGRGDSPIHGMELPAGEGSRQGDGDNEGEGGADGNVVGDPAQEGEGRDDDGPAADTETA